MSKLFVVGIGASAGGLQALEAFFAHLPEHPNAAFVVIQHLSPNFKSLMTELIQRQTKIPVHQIQDGMTLVPNAIYILPPGKNLSIQNQQLQLLEQPDRLNYPINQFFQALARDCGEHAIGILLSGTGNDGAQGVQAISRVGGIALVQSPETAQFTSMPTSASPSGLVDEILSPQDLADAVYGLVHFASNSTSYPVGEMGLINPNQFQRILDILAEHEQIDFSHYKISTLSRRIAHRLALTRNSNLDNYIRLLQDSEQEQKLLRQDMLIGTTRFFRDTEAWNFIETTVLPLLINRLEPQQQLRIWMSACATGEEAYSMAMLVDEALTTANKPIQVKIFATDLDTNALEAASYGLYPTNIASQISPERLERYFNSIGDQFQVKRTLREMLIIAPHDLTKNAGFSKMHLICCRNVLIYMQPQLQQQVLRLLHFSLSPQGVLFLGSSETLGDLSGEFHSLDSTWKVFQKQRDIQLSLSPINRPSIISPIPSLSQGKAKRAAFEPILEDVFGFCFADRKITCLLIDQEGLLLYIFCDMAGLLKLPVGEARLDVTQVIVPALKLPLNTALHRAKQDKQSVLYSDIKLTLGDEDHNVTLRVGFNTGKSGLGNYLIVFLEMETQPIQPEVTAEFEVSAEAVKQLAELEYELQQTRENLQVTIEELELANEEQQATNEELLASNEELQSTNEELQSVNEELYSVNAEYQTKIEQLTQLSNDIDNLLRSIDLGVVFLDRHLNIRKLTPAATRYINIRDSDINRPLAHFTHNLDCPNLLDILSQVIDTEQPVEQEITLLSMQQTLLMRVNPYLRENGSNNGVVVTLINITELKQIQNQLRSASLAKSEFLANMSHELRTPLNAILGFTQLMRRNSTLPAKIAENLQTIHRSGEHLLSLINTILDLAKIEAGRMSLEEKPCNLYDLLQGIEEMLRIKAESQGLQFAVEINPEVPQYVVVDVNKLRQLLTNLLGNAFKFTQQGSVLLKVQYVAETPTIQVEVQDTGCGIAAEELERIFEPFVQAKSTAFARQGTGLGLTISRSFVELMGGTLAVNSTLGQGSRFSFSIPVHLASPQDIEPMQSHLQVIGLAPDQPNYKILVVDDQSDNRRLVVQLLSSIGFEVREASDGEQALTLWQEWQPQLILMDILMPGINGYLVTQEIREREAVQGDNSLPRTKIIILTALAMKSDRDRALAVGGDDFLSKPFQESELFDKLAQHLGVRYLYKEPEQARDASQVVSASPAELKSYIAQMPQAWVEQMQEATLLGSENQVMQLIKQIPSDKAVLAQALTLILKRFNYESILTLLDFDA